ncbi:MAG: ADP-heptose--LPS heptosyltransferase [Acidobacteriota bacterium]|nr:ADP-heptose--LPS heptosyltransferase [Acidobacteriota bacterium]
MAFRIGPQLFGQAEEELRLREAERALILYEKAEKTGYDADSCAAARWTCHMLRGDFESAWKESDAIARRGNPDPNRFWDGQPFTGRRVLIRCLHGLGDTIQFIRYAELIRHQARSLTIEAQPGLKPLFESCGLADHVITWEEPEPPWDQQVEVMELPRIFRTTIDSIPAGIPYLRIPGTPRVRNHATLRVALVWASSRFNPARSIPLRTLADICKNPGVEFCSFQGGPEREELTGCALNIQDWDERTNNILGAAHSLGEVDLLITADTMMAHLAGALGRPVWILLPYEGDWRWMLNRSDSPWYPTMRLFRQAEPGDWDSVVEEVQGALLTQAVVRAV